MGSEGKLRLIFVDDELLVLEGLRRSLRGMRDEWSMTFVNSASEALKIMEQERFDVVISDMRMPEMDGSHFLQQVRSQYPETIRIVLSGHSSRESFLRSIAPSHQFLSKPCTADELKQRIISAFALQELLENVVIKQAIAGLESIPSLPAIYDEVVQEIQRPDASVEKLAAIISKDGPMTAKILQLANSALCGTRCYISSAAQAVTLIGLDLVRALVISAHIFSHFGSRKIEQLDIQQLWSHSLATASCAQAIARSERAAKNLVEECFTAGLLHDMGKLILVESMPEKYREVMRRMSQEKITPLQAEREGFHCTHAEVGAYLIAIWGLPHSVVEAVAWHHLPSITPTKRFASVTAVHVANAMLDERSGGSPPETALDQKHLIEIGLSSRESDWRQICQETMSQLKAKELVM